MKMKSMLKILCTVLLGILLAAALVGCDLGKQETVTVYPCYFNADVAGMDAATIRAALEQAGWPLISTTQNSIFDNALQAHIYKIKDGEQVKMINVYEFETVEQAKLAYEQEYMHAPLMGGYFTVNHTTWENNLRISNCIVWTISTMPLNVYEILGIEEGRALEIPMDNSYEMCREVDGVDINAVKAKMEQDGYTFYKSEFFVTEEEEGFSRTLVFTSPDQDRIYAYTFTQKPKLGKPYAYKVYHKIDDFMKDMSGDVDPSLGIHFVGFEDGSCILCYGDSFAEIAHYFTGE